MKKTVLVLVAAAIALTAQAQTPQYINTGSNHLTMNGADWSALRAKLAKLSAGQDTVVRILHIGDSHIQAEFVTNELRRLLQQQYGNAGRGLISPLRLAGTNQPHDYTITATSGTTFRQTRLLKHPWQAKPGLTGIAAEPKTDTRVTFTSKIAGHNIASAKILTAQGVKKLDFATPVDSLTTDLQAGNALYGAILENGKPGLVYSAIGNNGATFNDYLLIDSFPAQTRIFQPALIVLSMGTNEAFSHMTDKEIEGSARTLIALLRRFNPNAEMLLLAPMECQKNRNHGYRPLSSEYDVLARNADVADIIKRIGADMHVPVWDFFTVAGGDGASAHWLDDKLMNRDRIHLVKPGYELEARLLFDALQEQLAPRSVK